MDDQLVWVSKQLFLRKTDSLPNKGCMQGSQVDILKIFNHPLNDRSRAQNRIFAIKLLTWKTFQFCFELRKWQSPKRKKFQGKSGRERRQAHLRENEQQQTPPGLKKLSNPCRSAKGVFSQQISEPGSAKKRPPTLHSLRDPSWKII